MKSMPYSKLEIEEQQKIKHRDRMIQAADWNSPLDLILWEYKYFQNDIVFRGDDKPVKEKEHARS